MKKDKLFLFAPRIFAVLFILFLSSFSLDVLDNPGAAPKEIAFAFFIHNIPSFALAAVLAVAWKHETVGAAVFILAALAYSIMTIAGGVSRSEFVYSFIITGPALITGILFFISRQRKRKG